MNLILAVIVAWTALSIGLAASGAPDTRLVDAVVEGTSARTATIDPEGSRIEPGPDLYFTLLRNLARDLKACLAPAG